MFYCRMAIQEYRVIIRGSGRSNEYTLDISVETKILDLRLNAQTLLGFDDDTCQVVLEHNGEKLSDATILGNSSVQSGDVLLFIPPENKISTLSPDSSHNPDSTFHSQYQSISAISKTNTSGSILRNDYKLILTSFEIESKIWEYSISLQEKDEVRPSRFFQESGAKEYKRFNNFLKEALEREVLPKEVKSILNDWCSDIAQGYRITNIEI